MDSYSLSHDVITHQRRLRHSSMSTKGEGVHRGSTYACRYSSWSVGRVVGWRGVEIWNLMCLTCGERVNDGDVVELS